MLPNKILVITNFGADLQSSSALSQSSKVKRKKTSVISIIQLSSLHKGEAYLCVNQGFITLLGVRSEGDFEEVKRRFRLPRSKRGEQPTPHGLRSARSSDPAGSDQSPIHCLNHYPH